MKLTKIGVWNKQGGHCTYLRRYYDNPAMEHLVTLDPKKVRTYVYIDGILQPINPGILHLARPL